MIIKRLAWDSDFFGLKVGRCSLSDEDSWEVEKLGEWDLIYFFIDPDQLKANKQMQQEGIGLMDEKVTFVMDLKTPDDSELPGEVYSYTKDSQVNDVIRIGIQSGIYSRFNLDKKIPGKKFEELYSIWMNRSISREIARDVFVYKTKDDGKIAGVITLGDKNGRADIGIIAVDEKFRGLSIGKKLLKAVIKKSMEEGHKALQVVTQKTNLSACHFYEQCGFREDHVVNVYHYWNRS